MTTSPSAITSTIPRTEGALQPPSADILLDVRDLHVAYGAIKALHAIPFPLGVITLEDPKPFRYPILKEANRPLTRTESLHPESRCAYIEVV